MPAVPRRRFELVTVINRNSHGGSFQINEQPLQIEPIQSGGGEGDGLYLLLLL